MVKRKNMRKARGRGRSRGNGSLPVPTNRTMNTYSGQLSGLGALSLTIKTNTQDDYRLINVQLTMACSGTRPVPVQVMIRGGEAHLVQAMNLIGPTIRTYRFRVPRSEDWWRTANATETMVILQSLGEGTVEYACVTTHLTRTRVPVPTTFTSVQISHQEQNQCLLNSIDE